MANTILFRADGSNTHGGEYVQRLLCLAEEQRLRGGSSVFAVNADAGAILDSVERRGFTVRMITGETGSERDANLVSAIAEEIGANAIIVDGPEFSSDYLARLKTDDKCIVAIDDSGHGEYPVDILINPSATGRDYEYRVRPDTSLLMGAEYALLNPELLWHTQQPPRPTLWNFPRVLIHFGERPDSASATTRALAALPTSHQVIATVVLHSRFRYSPELAHSIELATSRGHVVELVQGIEDVARLMAHADMAITGCSPVIWELAYLSCPTVAYAVAEEQSELAHTLAKQHAVVGGQAIADIDDITLHSHIGHLLIDPSLRHTVAHNLATYVDGRGVIRVLDEVSNQVHDAHVSSSPYLRLAS